MKIDQNTIHPYTLNSVTGNGHVKYYSRRALSHVQYLKTQHGTIFPLQPHSDHQWLCNYDGTLRLCPDKYIGDFLMRLKLLLNNQAISSDCQMNGELISVRKSEWGFMGINRGVLGEVLKSQIQNSNWQNPKFEFHMSQNPNFKSTYTMYFHRQNFKIPISN